MSPAPTVLVVDDDPVTLQLLGAALRQQGYRILTAMDAMQAMMAVRRNSPSASSRPTSRPSSSPSSP